VVKAYTIFGFENLQDNHYPGYGNSKPVMLIAGDDAGAKKVVSNLAAQLGWNSKDSGPLSSFRLGHAGALKMHSHPIRAWVADRFPASERSRRSDL